jgi:Fic family protein
MRRPYRPPFTFTGRIVEAIGEIMRLAGHYEGVPGRAPQPRLRRENRIRTVRASLAIEGNRLDEEQVTAILEGRRVAGSAREVREVRNAIAAYEQAARFDPAREADLLAAHRVLMDGLVDDAGRLRTKGVGVVQGSRVAHVAPPAKRVPILVADLLAWMKRDRDTHPLVKSAAVHYEIEFIHPFTDGNGRVGRLWQHVALLRFHRVFEHVPVETVIHAKQTEYYRVLAACDRAGDSTAFVEFSLDATRQALASFLDELRPERSTAATRLEAARAAFGKREFSRKEYLARVKGVSTATASRDLQEGVVDGILLRTGTKAVARYRFRSTD